MVDIIILAIILAISIGLHEYAHARASNALGDPTPKLQGRLTPNPLAHLDPIGFLLIFIIHFGRWKPVQINPQYYKHPQRDEFLVAMAWPFSNIIMAIFGVLFIKIAAGDLISANLNNTLFLQFWTQFVFLNIGLALFNLLPIPPLDGWKIVKLFVHNAAIKVEYALASNPLLMIAIFYGLGLLGFFSFLSTRSYRLVNKLMWLVNLLR